MLTMRQSRLNVFVVVCAAAAVLAVDGTTPAPGQLLKSGGANETLQETQCSAGSYLRGSNEEAACVRCGEGKYSDDAGAHVCHDCPFGTTTTWEGDAEGTSSCWAWWPILAAPLLLVCVVFTCLIASGKMHWLVRDVKTTKHQHQQQQRQHSNVEKAKGARSNAGGGARSSSSSSVVLPTGAQTGSEAGPVAVGGNDELPGGNTGNTDRKISSYLYKQMKQHMTEELAAQAAVADKSRRTMVKLDKQLRALDKRGIIVYTPKRCNVRAPGDEPPPDKKLGGSSARKDSSADLDVDDEMAMPVSKRRMSAIQLVEMAYATFEKYDADRSGFIDRSELQKLLTDWGLESVPDEDLAKFDINGNGIYDFDEFVGLYNELQFRQPGSQANPIILHMEF